MMGQIYRRNLLFLLGGQTRPLPFSDIPPTAATSSPPKGRRVLLRPDFQKQREKGGGRERERTIFFRQINPANWGLANDPAFKDSANCNDGGDGRISREEILPLN